MDFKNVRHLREILGKDWQGNAVGLMEYSFDNASYAHPHFREVPLTDQANARALYYELGGRRQAEVRIGASVIIPNRGWSWRELFT